MDPANGADKQAECPRGAADDRWGQPCPIHAMYEEEAGKFRDYLRGMLDDLRKWSIVVALALSVATVAGFALVPKFVADRIEAAKKQATEEATKQLTADALRNGVIREFQNTLVAEHARQTRTQLQYTLSQLKLLLENERLNPPPPVTGREADTADELLFMADALLSKYAGPSRVDLSATRREALVRLVDAMTYAASGDQQGAEAWLRYASEVDPSFPEPYILLARLQIVLRQGDPERPRADEVPYKQAAAQCIATAMRTPEGPNDPEVQVAIPVMYWLKGELPTAIREGERLAKGAPPDARLLKELGKNCWLLSLRHRHGSAAWSALYARAVDYARSATEAAPRYSTAANNYLWIATHLSAEQTVSNFSDATRRDLRTRAVGFSKDRMVWTSPDRLDTLARASYVLWETGGKRDSDLRDLARKAADRALAVAMATTGFRAEQIDEFRSSAALIAEQTGTHSRQ